MPDRPSEIWKRLPLDVRERAADAFWRDDAPDADAQRLEIIAILARKLNFRARSVQALDVERRAKHLARLNDVSDAVATRALIAYHFAAKRPLMAAFLDAVGIAHDNGLITEEEVAPPDAARLGTAVSTLRSTFDPADVDLYLRTLVTLDGETWRGLDAAVGRSD